MRSLKLTIALAFVFAACSGPYTYPDLQKAKDTYAHAQKTGDAKAFPAEYDAAKKSIGAAQTAQDAQASFERGKDPSRERDLSKEALYRAEVADGAAGAAKADADRRAKEAELAGLQQEWDAKGSAIVEVMEPNAMSAYAGLCGSTLAKAHARSGDAIAIAAYLGNSDSFDQALSAFGETYADQNEQDYDALKAAVKSGRVKAETGL